MLTCLRLAARHFRQFYKCCDLLQLKSTCSTFLGIFKMLKKNCGSFSEFTVISIIKRWGEGVYAPTAERTAEGTEDDKNTVYLLFHYFHYLDKDILPKYCFLTICFTFLQAHLIAPFFFICHL